jgi:hypothetical protein
MMNTDNNLKEVSLLEQHQNGEFSSAHSQGDDLKNALSGCFSDIVAKHEEMVLRYKDVQKQADQSFKSAKKISMIGFAVLIITLVYTLFFDTVARFTPLDRLPAKDTFTVGSIGVVSGSVIEFIAVCKFLAVFRRIKAI